MRFEATFNLGHLIVASTLLVSVTTAYAALVTKQENGERNIAALQANDLRLAQEQRDSAKDVTAQLRYEASQVALRTASDIQEIKALMRDGFREINTKLDNKQDKIWPSVVPLQQHRDIPP